MSKVTVRKTIAEFDARQLRELILEVYSKSKEAKELLDFFATPDIEAKVEEYKVPLFKEINRVYHHLPHPRMPKIRSILKRFSMLEPGDEAIAQLRAYIMLEFCETGKDDPFEPNIVEAIDKFFRETLIFMKKRAMLDEYFPQFKKAIESMKDRLFFKNQLKTYLKYTLYHFEEDEED